MADDKKLKMTFYRIKDCLKAVAYYRDIRKKFRQAKKGITFVVRAGGKCPTNVCIKKDYTELPTADVFEVDPVEPFPRVIHCTEFKKNLCKNIDCPLYIRYLRYHNNKTLLTCAENSKHAAYRELFHGRGR